MDVNIAIKETTTSHLFRSGNYNHGQSIKKQTFELIGNTVIREEFNI